MYLPGGPCGPSTKPVGTALPSSAAVMPRSPGGPCGPGAPCGPISPGAPGSPLSPFGPGSPCNQGGTGRVGSGREQARGRGWVGCVSFIIGDFLLKT